MAKNSGGRVVITENFDGKPSIEFVKYSDMSSDQLVRLMGSGDINVITEYMKREKSK